MSPRLHERICIHYIICITACFLLTNITHAQEGDFEISVAIETPFGKKNINGTVQLSNAHMPWFERTEKCTPWYAEAALMAFKCMKLYRTYKQYRRAERAFLHTYQEWGKDQFAVRACTQYSDFAACSRPEIQCCIMAEYQLYQFKGFQELIRTFPCYQEYIITLYNRLVLDEHFKARTQLLTGYGIKSFFDVITEMAREIIGVQNDVPVTKKKSRDVQTARKDGDIKSRLARWMCTLRKMQNFTA